VHSTGTCDETDRQTLVGASLTRTLQLTSEDAVVAQDCMPLNRWYLRYVTKHEMQSIEEVDDEARAALLAFGRVACALFSRFALPSFLAQNEEVWFDPANRPARRRCEARRDCSLRAIALLRAGFEASRGPGRIAADIGIRRHGAW